MNHELEIELQREIDANRRSEFGLIPKALIAALVVAVLVVIRVVFFT
jgi:cell division protein FtsL